MENTIKKNDFIEIKFLAKTKDGEVFDTNILEEAKKINPNVKETFGLIISVGNKMVIEGLDESLIGKEVGKNYTEEFNAKKAFGIRNPELVKMVPLKAFTEQKINPQKGMQFSLDGNFAKIIAVSGGRILVDFNNPIAGKNVIYEYKIERKIEDIKEKVNAIQEFFIKRKFDFEIKDKKIIFKLSEKEKNLEKFLKIFERFFKEMIDMEISTEVIK
jgi:FKBP-type peptidyl-prolyl cis-trans isomerase 2